MDNIEDYKNELIDEVKGYSISDWYNLFVALFINSNNQEMDNIYSNIANAADDAFSIISVKKRYENGEDHKRIWNER